MDAVRRDFGIAIIILLVFLALAPEARGVASFARQTGLPCSACHTTLPELTPLGRMFKLNGYTMTGIQQITAPKGSEKSGLNLSSWLPLSAFFQISFTSTNQAQPGAQNGSAEFPQAASLFLAGAMSSHAGGFVQVTYTGSDDHFSWDNTDIRYANRTKVAGKELIYGVTVNNNPTVEDLWNDTPAFGFPFLAPDSTPSPLASTIIDGPLAQDVAGLGAYAMFDGHLYGDFTGYTSAHLGGPQPPTGVGFSYNIHGLAPYWRVAWQQSHGNDYLELGTYGIHVVTSPNTVVSPTDTYTDVAADLQWERVLPTLHNDLLTVHGTFIYENLDLVATYDAGGAVLPKHHLTTLNLNGIYHFGNKYAVTAATFFTKGTADALLYPPAPVSGSANGNPKSSGYTFNFSYWPVQNIQLAAQYTGYINFNGAQDNYDGAGRNASGNNSVYLVAWLNF
ncbi:MAG TPA: cytochrome C [Terriglobia bacterium]